MPGNLRATIAAIDEHGTGYPATQFAQLTANLLNHPSNDYPAGDYIDSGFGGPSGLNVSELYRAATTSLKVMSTVMVHPDVPRNSNGAGLGPRR